MNKINLYFYSITLIFFLSTLILLLSFSKFYEFKGNLNNYLLSLLSNNSNIIPKFKEGRVWEIDLTNNQIYFFENGKLKTIIPIAYQAPYGRWYQTPTGYFRVGIKKEKHISSLFPVYMNYAVQMYEDFFIHEIPYYFNGQRVSSDFSGGCIRLEKNYAQKFYNLAKKDDLIVSYLTFDNLKIKKQFHPPVDYKNFFIRQRFNNPLRTKYFRGEDRRIDYIQHAGLDLSPLPIAKDLNVYSIYDGIVVKIVENGKEDHGLGNTIIIEHQIENKKIYSLYAHLSEIDKNLKINNFVKKGQILGKIGSTGFGCDYWRIGDDGCQNNNPLDIHLHLEIKNKPILESPIPAECEIKNIKTKCYGYTPHNPDKFGYFDPLGFIFEKK
ncbi:MAG: peptidoglycan DD-metalloendopeptidase family protein [Patescibacteria group bacterium]|nr:peptidoglycan DD-metalloendopeptidase family protein [Patescibacteria group bacterium]